MSPDHAKADAARLLDHHRGQLAIHDDNVKRAETLAKQARQARADARARLEEAQAAHDDAHGIDPAPKGGKKTGRMPPAD